MPRTSSPRIPREQRRDRPGAQLLHRTKNDEDPPMAGLRKSRHVVSLLAGVGALGAHLDGLDGGLLALQNEQGLGDLALADRCGVNDAGQLGLVLRVRSGECRGELVPASELVRSAQTFDDGNCDTSW